MEYAEGGNLSSYLIQRKYLSEEEARKIFQQLIDCIYYFHQVGICHRNLKLENILFSSKKRDKIKIINFGHSNLYLTGVNSDNPTLSFGAEFLETPYDGQAYTPPEIILGIKYDGLLLDIWHCGIILFSLLFGSFPFQDKNIDNLYTKIIKGEFSYPKNILISEEAQSLLNKILVVNPRLRIDIINVKKDIWFLKDYEPIFGLYVSIRDIPISNKILDEMEKYGFKKNDVIKNIKNNRHNNITTCYYIIVKKLRKEGIETISDLISEDFKEYLREQDLKFNLIKKGEKPISLKLMKSKSKSIFDINDSNNNDSYKNVDFDYLKKIFQDYNSEDKSKFENKKNKHKIKNKNNKKNKKDNKLIKEQKKSKSQNSKKLDKKVINIKKDRYSYSTSLNKKNHKKIKEENKMKLLYKNKDKNIKIGKEDKNNNKIKQIINIKELIKLNNKNILNNKSKKFVKEESKKKHNQNLVINSTASFSKNKKNSLFINKNFLNNNNDSSAKLNKIKEIKEKYIKNYNIKNLSLKNKYTKEKLYEGLFSSRNYFETELNKENKTSRNFNHKNLINSTSNSKSRSLKSKSNFSTERGETIFCKNDSKKRKRKNYLNIKINIIKPSPLNKEKNISKNNSLKEKNKFKQSKSNSAPKYNVNRDKNKCINKQKRLKNSLYLNKKSKEKDKQFKNEIISDNYNNSKDKLNNKKINNKLKNQIEKNKQRIKAHLNSINNIERHLTDINKENQKDLSRHKNNDKIFSNTLKKLIPKKKEISPIDKRIINKKSLNTLINRVIPNLPKRNESKKIKNENKNVQNTYTNSIIQNKRKNSNRITNIRRASPQIERNKKNDNLNKVKIKEIKSIKIFNIPKSESFSNTARFSENRRSQNLQNKFYLLDRKIHHKNRMVINSKKFNNI